MNELLKERKDVYLSNVINTAPVMLLFDVELFPQMIRNIRLDELQKLDAILGSWKLTLSPNPTFLFTKCFNIGLMHLQFVHRYVCSHFKSTLYNNNQTVAEKSNQLSGTMWKKRLFQNWLNFTEKLKSTKIALNRYSLSLLLEL